MAADAESNELSDWIPEAVELGISLQGGRCVRTGEGEGRQRTDLSRQRLPLFSPCPPPHISGAWRPVALPRSCARAAFGSPLTPPPPAPPLYPPMPPPRQSRSKPPYIWITMAHHHHQPWATSRIIIPNFPQSKPVREGVFFRVPVAATSPAIHVWRQVQRDHEPGWRDVPIQNHVDKDAANHAANLLKSFMQRKRLLKTLQNLTPS